MDPINDINNRVLEALDTLVEQGTIRSVRRFCMDNGYQPSNLSRLRKQLDRDVPIRLVHALVNDYGISGDWLMTGKGALIRRRVATPI